MLQQAICKVTGTGAVINISIGFRGGFVIGYNEAGVSRLLWSYVEGAGQGQTGADSGAGAVDYADLASGGISEYAGGVIVDSDGSLTGTAHVVVNADGTALTNGKRSAQGITIGTNADFNASGEVCNLLVIERPAIATTSTVYTDEG